MDFMNVKTIAVSLITGSAFAAYPGHGNVCFKGSIIDDPYSISPDSIDQTLELGQTPNVALVDIGQSTHLEKSLNRFTPDMPKKRQVAEKRQRSQFLTA
jgi:type 1 fimbria pilin